MNSARPTHRFARPLADASAELARVLARSLIHMPPQHGICEIQCETVMVTMRDGVRLATDVYLPPVLPAPVIAVRTPYGRAADAFVGTFLSFVRRGYAVASQDCRGTGDSEPDHWDYYVYEPEDGYDFIEWVSHQPWFNGFLGACGGSYVGQTQWQMAMHPRMSTIVPEVSGLGVAVNTTHPHAFINAYARSIGKGADKLPVPYFELERLMLDETLGTGFFNEPLFRALPESVLARFPHLRTMRAGDAQSWLWQHYCALSCAGRAELIKELMSVTSVSFREIEGLTAVFGHRISHDAHTLPHPRAKELCQSLHTPLLLQTGWYDWGLNDALATWALVRQHAPESVRSRCKLIIAPSAHNAPGYHEGMADHPELHHAYRTATNVDLLLRWYAAVRNDKLDSWPTVIFYMMAANEWHCAADWPVPGVNAIGLYLGSGGYLSSAVPRGESRPDRYTYDPQRPTPTLGGSILSYVYPPGSVDVSEVQKRPDVLAYTTEPLDHDLDVVGALTFVLYASSSAVDTDFVVRLSDVFPDGRAIQLQNGVLRARYRNLEGEPELLEPERVYRLQIDMWATANRFKAGHRLRVDISSSDFPRFERHSNRAGEPGPPVCAFQTIYHDRQYPSHLLLPVLSGSVP